MSAPQQEEGHPGVAIAVLALAVIAALALVLGLVRAVAAGEVLAPVKIEPGGWRLIEGDPASLLGFGTALLLLLPVIRDGAIAVLAMKERAWSRVGLALLGFSLLVTLYAFLLLRG